MTIQEAYIIIFELAQQNALDENHVDETEIEQTNMLAEQNEALSEVHKDLSKRFPDFLT